MPFSQWNTLEVPLQNGWQCALVPASQYRHAVWVARGNSFDPYPLREPRWGWPDDRDRPWGHAAARTREAWRDDHERERWERDELERQRDEDRRDFHRNFRPDDDLRTITGRRNLETVRAFLSGIMVFAHWDEPETNEDVRRVLCDLVRNGQLVPYMKREWRQRPRVFRRPPAAERWPSGDGYTRTGCSSTGPVLTYAEFQALQRANGELPALDSSTVGTGLVAASSLASRASSAIGKGGSGVDWHGAISLSDGQPFEYEPDTVGADVIQLAARRASEAGEAQCFAIYEIDMKLCSAGAAMYKSPAYFLACKERAFQKYQRCRGY